MQWDPEVSLEDPLYPSNSHSLKFCSFSKVHPRNNSNNPLHSYNNSKANKASKVNSNSSNRPPARGSSPEL